MYTEYTPVAYIMNNTVFSQARTCIACLSLKNCSVIFCVHKNSLSSGQPCHPLADLNLTFSLPVHNTKHQLDSTTFSKTTLYTENLFHKRHCRKATLKNRSRMSITRVAETCEETLPQVMGPKSLRSKSLLQFRQFLEVLWKTFIN